MANIEELLAAAGTEDMDDELSYVIDEHLRVIAVPERGVVLGVEGDKNVNRVRFAINRYYHGSDFSKFTIRIHYENAEGERNYFTVTEKTVEEDRMSFIWTVDADAVAYKGSVHFVVNCFTASEDGTVTKAYHTTLGTASVLEGLAVDKDTDAPEIVDLLTRLEHDLGVYAGTLIVQAENAAQNAAESETAAANSAAAAKASETNAASSAGKAASSAAAAKTSETNAGTSAAAAKASETNASASAGKAANSATAAKTSETNAASSASGAASSASAAKASETNAGTSATAAKASETNASASAGKAASSESAAKTSETKAANSAAAAKTSEANAEAYSKQAQTIANGYKGWYADESALNAAMPAGSNGDWAMVGTSGSMWVWDGEKSKWKCSAAEGALNTMQILVPEASEVTEDSILWVRIGRLENTSDADSVRLKIALGLTGRAESTTNGETTVEGGASFGEYDATIFDMSQTDDANLAEAYEIHEINVGSSRERKVTLKGLATAANAVAVQSAEESTDDGDGFGPEVFVLATKGGNGTSCADVWMRLPYTMFSEYTNDGEVIYRLKARYGWRISCIWYGTAGKFRYDVLQTKEMPTEGTNCTGRYESTTVTRSDVGEGLCVNPQNDQVTLAPATTTILGGVKAGSGLNVAEDGTLSVANLNGFTIRAQTTDPGAGSALATGTVLLVYK